MENTMAIVEFENKNEMYQPKSIGAEMVASREAQEVQVAMIAAKKFPRDTIASYQRIMTDCQRSSLAEKAMYEFPRGGSMITGPSIHLARTLARGWGNLDSGFKVLDSKSNESTVMAYCWDLETNYRETKVFTVQHIRQTKKGAQILTDPRDIYEMIANQAARRERSCILSVIPADIVDAAVGQCNVTLQSGKDSKPLVDRVRDMIAIFQQQFSVTKEMLEAFIGCKVEAFSVQSVVRLRNVYNTLKDGSASVEQYFDMSISAPESIKKEKKKEEEKKEIVAKSETEEIKLVDLK